MRADVSKLIAEGWAVVPLLPGKKNPNDPDFLKKTYTAEDFSDNDNVGVKCGKPSGHRIDIDMDAPEAVAAGQALLYNTGLIHGRPGKPSSHWWYVCPGAVTKAYKDIDGTVLIEIRADGGQTVVPPSKHEKSGDVLRWERDGAPAAVAVDDTIHTVRATAVTAIFARHWPSGSRHYAAGHVAGFLCRLGYDDQWVVQIVEQIAKIAKDDEVKDRVKIAKDTCRKHRQGEKTTGGPKLKEVFQHGEKIAQRIYEWFGREGEDLLDELNERHFVARLGSDMVVCTEIDSGQPVIQSFDQFRQMYYNRVIGKQTLGEWWLKHRDRRSYDTIVFAPPPLQCNKNDYNLWRGFTVKPDPNPNPEKRCAKFLAHMLRVICDENAEHFKKLLDVCAITVQFPGRPSGVAFVMRGHQGAGKGTFAELFGSLFGIHFIQVDKPSQVTGDFNAHLSGKVVVFADEAVWGGNKQQVGALRRLVSERTVAVQYKYRDIVAQPNCVHLFMATNEAWTWPAALKERRGFIVDVPQKAFTLENPNYFTEIHEEWQNGGAEAFLALCQQRKLESLFIKIPVTKALMEQQQMSMDPMTSWWLNVLMEGSPDRQSSWPEFVDNLSLYESYTDAMRTEGLNRRGTSMLLSTTLKSLLPRQARQDRRYVKVNTAARGDNPKYENQQRRGWVLPTLQACRAAFDAATGAKYPWPEDDVQAALAEVGNDAL